MSESDGEKDGSLRAGIWNLLAAKRSSWDDRGGRKVGDSDGGVLLGSVDRNWIGGDAPEVRAARAECCRQDGWSMERRPVKWR